VASPAAGTSLRSCWICGATPLHLVRPSSLSAPLSSRSFAITDSHYGTTAAIHRCDACGFLQCPEIPDVLSYYQQLEDPEYESGRAQRRLQARKLLEIARRHRPGGTLVDIGAGSGILVEEALAMGYRAEGIEPSRWLQERAQEHGLRVHLGVAPHPDVPGPFDVVALIDVLEHVSAPVELLRAGRDLLAPDGIGLVVTPDVHSLAARLMGRRWWHYRVAHIGYFGVETLTLALRTAGLEPIEIRRPGWVFPADYLVERTRTYLPRWLHPPNPAFLARVNVPLNLRDSLLAVFRRAEA